ncbi:MAG: pyruvate dehydrogenase complex dihydrolipoamide acetyltransferase [Hyphomonadaceae bacterium]|nr:pyruvate dehydrogenase complex dihydrolipoamide acetyltransferase [Hyphomonadaceae bacterium]OUX94028.1 MAG: pyruvate dehydrogenase complex dihydrolipoamide acetyltransferase [Hyphomonas sp. TMED17]
MSIEILMPALSPTMEEGTLAKWLVAPGDQVRSGDLLAEIETDKATMEVEAVDEGVVAELLVEAGTDGVKVNAIIAVLAEDGEDPAALIGKSEKPAATEDIASAPPVAASEAKPAAVDAALASPPPVAAQTEFSGRGTRIKASPLARRIAKIEGVTLEGLKGSGPHGRIIKQDVLAAVAEGRNKTGSASAVQTAPQSLIQPQILDDRIYAPDSYELVALDGMRRTVAKRLTESFMQVPHFPLNTDVKLDRLLDARRVINAAAPDGVKISVNDMLIKASALALMAEPDCNSSYTDNGIAFHKSAYISVAVAVDGGLITPVIRHAEAKGLAEIATEMKDLAERARSRSLKPEEFMGGTFSISNLGMFGIKSFGSIINPPEGMILSVGAGERRPVIGPDDELIAATMMSLTLTCDHRVIGGAEGARWLAAFKRFVETPESMLL